MVAGIVVQVDHMHHNTDYEDVQHGHGAQIRPAVYVEQPGHRSARDDDEQQPRGASGVALRIINDGRLGLSATTDPAAEHELVSRVGELAPFGADAAFEMPGADDYPSVDIYDPAVESLEFDTMVQTGQTLIDAVRKDWPELNCSANVSRGVHKMSLANT